MWEQFLSWVDKAVVLARPGQPTPPQPATRPQVGLREGWLCPFKPALVPLKHRVKGPESSICWVGQRVKQKERGRDRWRWGRPAPDVTRALHGRFMAAPGGHHCSPTVTLTEESAQGRCASFLRGCGSEELQEEGAIWETKHFTQRDRELTKGNVCITTLDWDYWSGPSTRSWEVQIRNRQIRVTPVPLISERYWE